MKFNIFAMTENSVNRQKQLQIVSVILCVPKAIYHTLTQAKIMFPQKLKTKVELLAESVTQHSVNLT